MELYPTKTKMNNPRTHTKLCVVSWIVSLYSRTISVKYCCVPTSRTRPGSDFLFQNADHFNTSRKALSVCTVFVGPVPHTGNSCIWANNLNYSGDPAAADDHRNDRPFPVFTGHANRPGESAFRRQ